MNFLNLFRRKPKLCPNCLGDKNFPDNAILQMCPKCTKEGYDYNMFFNTTTGTSFFVVFMKKPQPDQS